MIFHELLLQETLRKAKERRQNDDKEQLPRGAAGDLFNPLLRDFVSPHHAMMKLADAIDGQSFEYGLSARQVFAQIAVGLSVRYVRWSRCMSAKCANGMSDEAVLDEWQEEPYWKYLTDGICFEYEYPTEPLMMSHWRKKTVRRGAECRRLREHEQRKRENPSIRLDAFTVSRNRHGWLN